MIVLESHSAHRQVMLETLRPLLSRYACRLPGAIELFRLAVEVLLQLDDLVVLVLDLLLHLARLTFKVNALLSDHSVLVLVPSDLLLNLFLAGRHLLQSKV